MKTRFRGPLVAQRRSDDWLNHAERSQPRSEKRLQITSFRRVRHRASLCPTRAVTPEVAGSSPVAPASKFPCKQEFLLSLTTPERRLVVHSWPEAETQNTCKSRFRVAACAPVSQPQPGHRAGDRRLATPVALSCRTPPVGRHPPC